LDGSRQNYITGSEDGGKQDWRKINKKGGRHNWRRRSKDTVGRPYERHQGWWQADFITGNRDAGRQ
jgi:hypothetical protein